MTTPGGNLPHDLFHLLAVVRQGDMTALGPLADCLEDTGDTAGARRLRIRAARWRRNHERLQSQLMAAWGAAGGELGFAELIVRCVTSSSIPWKVSQAVWKIR